LHEEIGFGRWESGKNFEKCRTPQLIIFSMSSLIMLAHAHHFAKV
jgi:hypothetical protein